jgi:hypothetical protein
MPSINENASMRADVERHVLWNNDYPDDWMLRDPRLNLRAGDPELFLKFLCLMAHPLARPDADEAAHMVDVFNQSLAFDDLEIVELHQKFDGIVWTYRQRVNTTKLTLQGMTRHAKNLALYDVTEQLRRINEALPADPAQAIGQTKEMVESVCKEILDARGKSYGKDDDLTALVAQVRKELKLVTDDIDDHAKGYDSIKRLLSSLGQIAQSLAELRNLYGTGHGKSGRRGGPQPRHARLVVGSAAALCEFLLDTHLSQHESGQDKTELETG